MPPSEEPRLPGEGVEALVEALRSGAPPFDGSSATPLEVLQNAWSAADEARRLRLLREDMPVIWKAHEDADDRRMILRFFYDLAALRDPAIVEAVLDSMLRTVPTPCLDEALNDNPRMKRLGYYCEGVLDLRDLLDQELHLEGVPRASVLFFRAVRDTCVDADPPIIAFAACDALTKYGSYGQVDADDVIEYAKLAYRHDDPPDRGWREICDEFERGFRDEFELKKAQEVSKTRAVLSGRVAPSTSATTAPVNSEPLVSFVAGKDTRIVRLEVPKDTVWSNITLRVAVDCAAILISVGGERTGSGVRYHPSQLGFANQRTGTATKPWKQLCLLAMQSARLETKGLSQAECQKVEANFSALRRGLRVLFPGMQGDPFPKRDGRYTAAFKLFSLEPSSSG